MSLQILSDLHLETPAAYDLYTIEPQAPYLALLGDIGNVRDPGYSTFLEAQLAHFEIVFLVLGNHEPYHSSWDEARASIRALAERSASPSSNATAGHGKLVLLDQTRFDLPASPKADPSGSAPDGSTPTITILGCTLHARIDLARRDEVSFGLNDFYDIRDWTIDDHDTAHQADLAWLNQQVAMLTKQSDGSEAQDSPQRTIIILTHHAPTTLPGTQDPYHTNSAITSGFATDLSQERCMQTPAVKLWAFGHTHYNCDVVDPVSGTRLLANQRGYYFRQAKGFEPEKVEDLSKL